MHALQEPLCLQAMCQILMHPDVIMKKHLFSSLESHATDQSQKRSLLLVRNLGKDYSKGSAGF